MRKHILIFGHGYAPQFIDISNQYTKLFDPHHYAVTVAYLVGAPHDAVCKKHLAENIIFLNSPKKSTRGLKIANIKKMLQLHQEKKFSAVICHRYKPTYIMLHVSLFHKIPLLIAVMHELNTLRSIFRRIAVALLARNNVFFAGVSNAVRDDIRHCIWRIPTQRVITLYNMIDVEATESQLLTRAEARKQLALPSSAFVFGTLGRLVKNKDQSTLIQAFYLIKAHCPQARLIIIGDGILETELKNQVNALGLTEEVIFTGFVANAFTFMKAFDIYVSSSIQEAFGRVLLEAMVAKVPIIATRINGVPEVIGESGVLLEAANPSQLAEKMLAAYHASGPELNQQGNKGYQRALKEFSIPRFKEIFEKEFKYEICICNNF